MSDPASEEPVPVPDPDTLAERPPPLRRRRRPPAPLFRVVEVGPVRQGRLARTGQIWHADLDHVRRFGRALAANSASHQVLVTDAEGAVLERIPVLAPGTPAGWTNWREQPLPPMPPRPQPRRSKLPPGLGVAPPVASPPAAIPSAPGVRAGPPVDLPVVQAEVDA